jgi:hypothetical protein
MATHAVPAKTPTASLGMVAGEINRISTKAIGPPNKPIFFNAL